MTTVSLDLPYHSPSQGEIFDDKHKYVVCPAGRRFGKTKGAANADIELAVSRPKSLQLWVDTTQENIQKYWDEYFEPVLKPLIEKNMAKWNRVSKVLSFWNGSRMHFGSAEKPENIEGHAYHRITLNEAGIILKGEKGRKLWFSTIAPMMLVPGGGSQAYFIGTPKGLGLFKEFAARGDDPAEKDWITFHRTTYNNPLLGKSEIDALVKDQEAMGGQRLVQQEIFAKFMEDDEGTPVIPYELAFAALKRVLEPDLTFHVIWGCDPSGGGVDDAALAKRRHNLLLEPVLTRDDLSDGEMGAWWIKREYDETREDERPHQIIIDAAGIGQGWYTHARALGLPVYPVDWGKGPIDKRRFHRRKDELWWAVRERMENLSLNNDSMLLEELTKPLLDQRWNDEKGIIKVEPKDTMFKRLGKEGKSPNRADAFIISFACGVERRENPNIDPWESVRSTEDGVSWMGAW